MTTPIRTRAQYQAARWLDPYHVEFPCVCAQCRERFSVYRAPGTSPADVLLAAVFIHRELSSGCHASQIRVMDPIPYGNDEVSNEEDHGHRQAARD